MLMRQLVGCSALIGLAALAVGCGGGSTVPKLAPVSGTIQMEGKPAAGVVVTFSPVGDTKTTGASGVTDADGKYQLTHRSGERGIEPGKYTVTFSRMAQADGTPVPPGTSPTDVGAVESIPEAKRSAATQPDVPATGGTFDFTIGK